LLVASLAAFDFLTIQDFHAQEGTLRIRYGKFAEMLAVISPVLFSAALIARKRDKFLLALSTGSAAWIGAMLSLSKGAFLAGVAGFAILFVSIVIFRRDLFKNAAAAAGVLIAVTLIFQLGFSSLTSLPSTVNYISGSADATRSTSDMRIYTWRIAGQMILSNLLFGVGADNFGLAVNSSKATLAQADPNDPDSAIGEDYIFERAHNEPLQIFAELGLVGFGIFAVFVLAVVAFLCNTVYRARGRLSPLFFGGVAGITAFFVSSLVSSFSFRAYQNGLVFFIVLGLTLTFSRNRDRERKAMPEISWKIAKPLALTAAGLLFGFSCLKAASHYTVYFGERNPDVEAAIPQFELASLLDPDNPGAELAAAQRLVREEQWAESVPHFRRAIDRGFGVSIIYSFLANAQELAGDGTGAEATLKEAVAIFPRSPFLRARLVIVQEKLGKHSNAAEQIAIARAIDERQVNGWYVIIKDGILNAHLAATADPTHIAPPPELRPGNAVDAYNTDKVQAD
jgi:hypothetical protein